MRGWARCNGSICTVCRVFPAHAGVSLSALSLWSSNTCIPCTCGGEPLKLCEWKCACGYSLHMRGWASWQSKCISAAVVFPAHAGVNLYNFQLYSSLSCIPCTCGGDIEPWKPHFLNLLYIVFPVHAGVNLTSAILTWCINSIACTCRGETESQGHITEAKVFFASTVDAVAKGDW